MPNHRLILSSDFYVSSHNLPSEYAYALEAAKRRFENEIKTILGHDTSKIDETVVQDVMVSIDIKIVKMPPHT